MGLIDNKEKTLQEALKNALPSTGRIDILTAYFYFSGFSALVEKQVIDEQVIIIDPITRGK